MQRLLACLLLLLNLLPAANAAAGPFQTPAPQERAVLEVWNRQIVELRAIYDGRGPAERARRAVARILAVPAERGSWVVARRAATVGEDSGFLFTVNGELAFSLLEGDVDSEGGQTLEQAAAAAEARLGEAMAARGEQRRWPQILLGVGFSIGLTALLVASLIAARRLRNAIQARLAPVLARARERAVLGGIHLWPILGGLRQMLTQVLTWSVGGGLIFLWLALVLLRFPYTEPWGDALGGFVLAVLAKLGWGLLASAPGLFAVVVIFALARTFARGVGLYFLAIEREEVAVAWLAGETARATRQLLTILIWVLAVVIAYPYIPGSGTDAFKGMSVLLGLMVSLGSAGLVNQVMSGLTVVYSRAYRHGDFVQIGDFLEGRVQSVGLLTTRIVKPGGEVVSVPNAVVTSHATTNFSGVGRDTGEVLATSVTIGYDAPWRQIHGLLQLAAQRTPQLEREPAPFVLQRALTDFAVEYQLVARLTQREARAATQSRLHAEIQDAFNEHGVQIMSPHFEAQPEKAVVVPRQGWFAAPAAPESPRA